MAKRKIMTGDAPCLYRKAREVVEFNARLAALLDDMAETMYEAEGCGLAAPQVGIGKRVFVVDCGDGIVEFVNPVVLSTEGEQAGKEGCLSFPGESGFVIRPNKVKMRAQDRHGKWFEVEGEELFARAMLHENDHLDGLVYKRLITEPPEGWQEDTTEDMAEDDE